ncbi:MAG: formate/nitrite transporter family protein [Hyphomonadaceae bacterium]
MPISETIRNFAELASAKIKSMRENPVGFFIAAMLAGAYVGIGIILILSVGEHADPALRTLIMGASFSVALTLVVFAGSELFTGYTMYMSIGWLARKVSAGELGLSWIVVWVGNLAGCIVLAGLAIMGAIDVVSPNAELLYGIADKKIHLSASEMIARGILCNWLVCLALWTAARTKDDTAKLFLIFWCLFAFIASGFEHSVANMTVFALALLSDHPETVSLIGASKNLLFVTIGNTISGTLFLGGAYWLAGASQEPDKIMEHESSD